MKRTISKVYRRYTPAFIAGALSSLLVTLLVLSAAGALGYVYRAEIIRWLSTSDTPQVRSETPVRPPGEQSIIDVVARSNPAVVSIVATTDVPVIEQYYREFSVGPFRFRVPALRQNGTREEEIGGGSGFIVSPDGMVATNRHVVDIPGARFALLLQDGTQLPVSVAALDPVFDIAILKIRSDRSDFPYLSFGDSDALSLGQTVIAIGNALGEFQNSVSVGVVSGLSRSIVAGDGRGRTEALEGVIQTDAAINPGNSGGPLLDSRGAVIGINVAVAQGSENIGFSLPGNLVAEAVAMVREYGEIRRE